MVGYWLHEGVGKQEIGGVDGQTAVTGNPKATVQPSKGRTLKQLF